MRVDLDGKVALVTGASRGIGLAIARALAEAGAGVAMAARGETDLRAAAADIGERARAYPADIQSAAACARLVEQTVGDFGRLDILVNNAGVGIFRSVADMSVEEWDTVLGTNLDSLFYSRTRRCRTEEARRLGHQHRQPRRQERIPGGAAYNASKFGLIGFSEALMQEVRHDGMRVSYIMPGSVSTEGFGGG